MADMSSLAPWMNDPTQMSPMTNLGLQMLANSNTPGGFGSIFGRSALAAGQDYQAAAYNQQKLQQLQQQNQQQAFLQELARKAAAAGGGQPPQGLLAGGGADGASQGQPAAAGSTDPSQPAFMPGVSQMPAQQAPSFGFTQPPGQQGQPPQPSQPGAQAPSWLLNPPTPQDIAASTGQNGANIRASAISRGEYTPQTEKGIQELGQTQWQQALKPKLASLDMLIKSPTPSTYMRGDPGLMAAWPQIAQRAGIDPSQYNDDNVRYALNNARNQVATSVGLPELAPTNKWRTVTLADGRTAQINDLTGEEKIEAASDLEKVIGPDGQPTLVPKGKAAGMTPFNQSIFGAANMSDQAIQSAADYARGHGYQMPTGFSRSPAMVAKVWDRIATDSAASGDTMGAITARGQALKANGAALTQITKLETATNQYANTLDKNLDNLVAAYQKAGDAGSPLMTRAVRAWQQGVTGDKDTAAMVTWLNAVQGEYAKLKSGSLGNAGATNAAMDDAKEVINKNMNQGGIEAVAAAMRAEKENRVAAIGEEKQRLMGSISVSPPGTRPSASGGASPTPAAARGVAAPASPPAAAPVRVNSPQEALQLAPGTVFMTPDGRTKVR